MNRREAIKNMSLSFGGLLVSSTILSMLQSCTDKTTNWRPEFLNKEQIYIIDHLVDLILPKTTTPGGLELNLTQFIDKFVAQIKSKEAQNIFNLGSETFSKEFKSTYKKEAINGSEKEFNQILDIYFNISDSEQHSVFSLLSYNLTDIVIGQRHTYLIYKFLTTVREISLLGYYTSQEIMEDVQGYVSVPGAYNSCVDLKNNS